MLTYLLTAFFIFSNVVSFDRLLSPLSSASNQSLHLAQSYGDGTDADDLQATEGEHIYLTEKISDDWWRAMSQDQSRTGIIPTTYVRQL